MAIRRVVGCMTGTSIDGLDAALIEIEGSGLAMRAKVVRCVSRPLGEVGTTLRMIAEQKPMIASEIAAAMHTFAMLHAAAIQELLAGQKCDLACVHGQTVFHKPPHSWQLMQPAPIAAAIGCPVVYDLRQADLAAGGQGAPITPIADWVFFGDLPGFNAVANLGGYCNITELPAAGLADTINGRPVAADGSLIAQVRAAPPPRETRNVAGEIAMIHAFDVCACNQVLDEVARKLMRQPFDDGGERASTGKVSDEALTDLQGIFSAQSKSKRSLGTGDEVGEWISRYRARLSPEDLAATACEAIGQTIADVLDGHVDRLFVAGGGVKNKALMKAIYSCGSARVEPTDVHGVPAAYREAACFAVLGALCQDKVPITLPAVTGVKNAPLSGAWVYP